MVEIYLNLPSKKSPNKSRHTTLFALLGKKQNASYSSLSPASFSFPDFPSAAAAAPEPDPLHLPPIPLCYLCSLLSLIYCPLCNTGRVKCKLADQGKQQKTEVKLKTALCYSALSMWGDCAITRHLTPPLKKQRQSTAVAGDRRLCQMAKRRR